MRDCTLLGFGGRLVILSWTEGYVLDAFVEKDVIAGGNAVSFSTTVTAIATAEIDAAVSEAMQTAEAELSD
jgi:hypothetical protein